MPLDVDQISTLAGDLGKDAYVAVKPYLPALAREGKESFDNFIVHVLKNDWPAVNALMYEKMTMAERRELEDAVYKRAVDATKAKLRRKEIANELWLKLAMSLLTKLI